MATYVKFTRDEFEDWLTSTGYRWSRKAGTAGIYSLPLSDRVAIEVSSSLSGRDDVVEQAQASMGVKLVSLITGFTLNKVAQGQSHFKRTINWRDSLKKGLDRMDDAYKKSSSFYEALAEIEDRDAYKVVMLDKIQAIPNWKDNEFLSDLHGKIAQGGILTLKQKDALENFARKVKAPEPQAESPVEPEIDVQALGQIRALYVVSKAQGKSWEMDFTKSVGEQVKRGRPLSPRQRDILERMWDQNQDAAEAFLRTNPQVFRVASQYLAQHGISA